MTQRFIPGLGMTSYWPLGDNYKTEMDANMALLSVVPQLSVKSATTALPGTGLVGDVYLVPDSAMTNPDQIAYWDAAPGPDAWAYIVPEEGWRCWVKDTGTLLIYKGAVDGWEVFAQGSGGGGGAGGIQTGFAAKVARYWAILQMGTDTPPIGVADIQFRETVGGPRMAATAIGASSEDPVLVATRAYDGNTATEWEAAGINGNEYLLLDLGAGNEANVAEVSITARAAPNGEQAPQRWSLAYSDDGIVWTVACRINDAPFADGETRNYDVSDETQVLVNGETDLRIDTTVGPASGQVDVTGIDLAERDGMLIYIDSLDVDADDAGLDLTFYVGGTEVVSGYQWVRRLTSANDGSQDQQQTNNSAVLGLVPNVATWGLEADGSNFAAVIEILNADAAANRMVRGTVSYTGSGGSEIVGEFVGVLRDTAALTGFKLAAPGGMISTASVRHRVLVERAGNVGELVGGGGGTDLPAWTIANNGQVLGVVAGSLAWVDQTGGSGLPDAAGASPGQILGLNGDLDPIWLDDQAGGDPDIVHSQLTVLSRTTDAATATTDTGARYIVPDSATGAWNGEDRKIAEWDGSQWVFTSPSIGWIAHVRDTRTWVSYSDRTTGQWDTPSFVSSAPSFTIKDVNSTSYNFVESDFASEVLIRGNESQLITMTIPAGITAARPLVVKQQGNGQVTVEAAPGVTLTLFEGRNTTAGPGATITLVPEGPNLYSIQGNAVAP